MRILGFQKTTLLDYPQKLASTIFLGGCNFRCPFCHNSTLITNLKSLPEYPEQEILYYLEKRKNILEGVCITGGEPTLFPQLYSFIEKIKQLGYLIKLDTNGSNPSMVQSLIDDQLIDYAAMDIKNCPEKYGLATGTKPNLNAISATIQILMRNKIPYEFRTTIVKELHTQEDIIAIAKWIHGASQYYLQPFLESGSILCPNTYHSWDSETLQKFLALIRPHVDYAALRGIDY